MLDNTHDPMGDFINAACSDVIAFCANQTYEQFQEATGKLNEKVHFWTHFPMKKLYLLLFLQSTFKHLCSRASLIGYEIKKVVFRGFHSSEALQNMHDTAIKERTK